MAMPKLPPEEKRQAITIKLPPWLIAWLRGQANTKGGKSIAKTIENSLIQTHKLTPPDA